MYQATKFAFLRSIPRGFTPDKLPGLIYWSSADTGVFSDAGTTAVTNGGTSQQWNNLKNSVHLKQATGTQRPIWNNNSFNGKPGLTFDGVDDWMLTDVDSLTHGGTNVLSCYMVCKLTSIVLNARWASFWGTGADPDYADSRCAVLMTGRGAERGSGTFRNQTDCAAMDAVAGTNYRMATLFDGTTNYWFLNNAQSGPYHTVSNTGSSGGITFTSPGTFGIGAGVDKDGPTSGQALVVAEVCLYDTFQNSIQRGQLDDYFRKHWAL